MVGAAASEGWRGDGLARGVGDTCALHPSERPAALGSRVRPSRLVK